MMDSLKIRDYKESDTAFIVMAWSESYKGSDFARSVSWPIYKEYYRGRIIPNILERSNVKVACLEEDPDIVIGFLVYESIRFPDRDNQWVCIHYLFVKKEFQRLGVAKRLAEVMQIKDGDECRFTHLTRLWECEHVPRRDPDKPIYCAASVCGHDASPFLIQKKYPHLTYNPYLI